MAHSKYHWAYIIGLVLLSSSGGSPAFATQSGDDRMYRPHEATIYRDSSYRGPALSVSEAKADLRLSWPVNSIRVGYGQWQLCDQTRYRGRCRTVDRDTAVLSGQRGMTVRSMRPIGGNDGGQHPPARDEVARGKFAEFHTQPSARGRRILACSSGSSTIHCAARTADDWCRSVGWGGSAREHMETVDRRIYLADVLCVRTGY